MALQIIPKRRALSNLSLVHLFSTAADPDDCDDRPRSSFSSYFSDVKSTLRQEQSSSSSSLSPPINRLRSPPPNFPSRSEPPRVKSLEEVHKSLSSFRLRVADSSHPPDVSAARSVFNRSMEAPPPTENGGAATAAAGRSSLGAIREGLGNIRLQSAAAEKHSSSLSVWSNILRTPQADGYTPSRDLPASVFGKEMKEEEEGRGGRKEVSQATKTKFVKMYSYIELGDKLRKLRPEGKPKDEDWFSVEELSGRLEKLREDDSKEMDSQKGFVLKHVRDSLFSLSLAEEEKSKKKCFEHLDIINQMALVPSFMKLPPKEHLLDTYNHPDNMSAAEKMKIELAKVREEFKMSESDCGSTRVQVALLTTKIKYLSSVLHKKDKHSRKGLVEMVHKRKRLLKYLRRTDWDSYCFVLDKLGLRDTPEYKVYESKH